MNNNRGWGLRSELWICLGMILFFAIAVILINRVFNNMDENGTLPIKDKNSVEEVKPKDDNKNAPYDNPIVNFTIISPNSFSSEHGSNTRSSVNIRIAKEVSKKFFEIYQ